MPTGLDPDTGQRITDEKLAFDPQKIARGLDDAEKYANDPENATDSLEDKENSAKGAQNPGFVDKTTKQGKGSGGRFNMNKLRGSSKKPLGIVGGLLIGFASITALFGAPAALFAVAVNALTNAKNFSAESSYIHGNRMVANKLGRTAAALKQGACSNMALLRCKSSTMTQKQIDRLRAADIRVNVDPDSQGLLSDRFAVQSIEIPTGHLNPDGTKAYSAPIGGGDALNRALKEDKRLRTAYHKGFNGHVKSFFSPNFGALLQKAFKTNKANKMSGKSEKELRESLDKSLGNEPVERDEKGRATQAGEEERKNNIRTKVANGLNGKWSSRVQNIAGAGCIAYNGARAILAVAKAQQILELGRAFVVHASIWHKAMSGNADPPVVGDTPDETRNEMEFEGQQMNYSEANEFNDDGSPNPFYDSTFMDSEGMQIALHGDVIGLIQWAQLYIVGGNEALRDLDSAVKNIDGFGGGASKTAIKYGCKLLMGPLNCVLAAGASLVPGVAAFTGRKAFLCGAAYVAMSIAFIALAKAIQPAVESMADDLAEMNINDDTKGRNLGDVVAFGAGWVLGRKAQQLGLTPSRLEELRQYRAETASVRQEIAEIQREEAKKTPFDVTNQYSFLGTIAQGIYKHGGISPTFMGNISRVFGILPASLSTTTGSGSVGAAWIMEDNEWQDGWYQDNGCGAALDDVADGDDGCAPGWSMSKAAYDMSIEANLDFMIDRGYAHPETGKPLVDAGGQADSFADGLLDTASFGAISAIDSASGEDEPAHIYAKWYKYCNNRDWNELGPPGETTEPIENGTDADEKWRTMAFCTYEYANQEGGPTTEELDNFSAFASYFGEIGSLDSMDEEGWDKGGDTTSGPYTKNTGPWVIPTSGPCLSGFGERWGAHHDGIDISPPSGTPIVAPTSMEITHAGDKGDGFGTSITATATDDSGNSFLFGHMIAGSPTVSAGQKVSKGDTIGQVGTTGYSTGPHLHFNIYPPGGGAAVDPIPVLSQHQVSISCGS